MRRMIAFLMILGVLSASPAYAGIREAPILYTSTSRLTNVPVFHTSTSRVNGLSLNGDILTAATPGGVLRLDLCNAEIYKTTYSDSVVKPPVLYTGSFSSSTVIAGRHFMCIEKGGEWVPLPLPGSEKIDAIYGCADLYCASGGTVYRLTSSSWAPLFKYKAGPNSRVLLGGEGNRVYVISDGKLHIFQEGKPLESRLPPSGQTITCAEMHMGEIFIGTSEGIYESRDEGFTHHLMPEGSHISALCSWGGKLYCGVYDAGICSFDGGKWEKVTPGGMSRDFMKVTALLVVSGDSLFWGTEGSGIISMQGGELRSFRVKNELEGGDIISLARYRESLYAATFEGRLMREAAGGWECVEGAPSQWMRHLAAYDDMLFVRDADGNLYRYDGTGWGKIVLKPSWTSFITVDGCRLTVGGYGGLMRYDGVRWEAIYNLVPLKGQVITSALSQGEGIWVGTAKAGCFFLHREGSTWKCDHYPIVDPWVTALALNDGTVSAGTFNGGIFSFIEGKFRESWILQERDERYILSLASAGASGLYIGTRRGLFHLKGDALRRIRDEYGFLDEIQALFYEEGGLWVGTPHGLSWLPGEWLEREILQESGGKKG